MCYHVALNRIHLPLDLSSCHCFVRPSHFITHKFVLQVKSSMHQDSHEEVDRVATLRVSQWSEHIPKMFDVNKPLEPIWNLCQNLFCKYLQYEHNYKSYDWRTHWVVFDDNGLVWTQISVKVWNAKLSIRLYWGKKEHLIKLSSKAKHRWDLVFG